MICPSLLAAELGQEKRLLHQPLTSREYLSRTAAKIKRLTVNKLNLTDILKVQSLVSKGAVALYTLLADMGHAGRERVYATADYLAVRMGCSESTYHRRRRELERAGLLVIERRQCGPRRHRSSLMQVIRAGVEQMRAAMDRATAAMRERRMGVKSDTDKQSHILNNKKAASFKARVRSPLYRNLMAQGLWKTKEAMWTTT